METRDISIRLCSVNDDRMFRHHTLTQINIGMYRNTVIKTPPVKVFSFNGEILIYHFCCLTIEPPVKLISGTEQTLAEYQTDASGYKEGLQHYCINTQVAPEPEQEPRGNALGEEPQ